MPIVEYSPNPLNTLKRKRNEDCTPINFANCVISIQFNVGKEFDYPQPKERIHVDGKENITLTLKEELTGIMLICMNKYVMEGYMVSTGDLSLEMVSPDGNIPMPPFDKSLCGFKTPELKLAFGEKDEFLLKYTNAFDSVEVLRITLACEDKGEWKEVWRMRYGGI